MQAKKWNLNGEKVGQNSFLNLFENIKSGETSSSKIQNKIWLLQRLSFDWSIELSMGKSNYSRKFEFFPGFRNFSFNKTVVINFWSSLKRVLLAS